jgi:hypothetical protein
MSEVLPEAYELVEHGLLTDDDFRDFMFTNAVRFWGEVNPDFFKGTVVEKQAAEVLARPRRVSNILPEADALELLAWYDTRLVRRRRQVVATLRDLQDRRRNRKSAGRRAAGGELSVIGSGSLAPVGPDPRASRCCPRRRRDKTHGGGEGEGPIRRVNAWCPSPTLGAPGG